MMIRSGNACLALVALLFLTVGLSLSAPAEERALSGQVVDTRGAGVAGATIFLTPVGSVARAAESPARLRPADGPIGADERVLRSGADGTFSMLLPAGRYRLAAFKPGFEVAVADLNLLARGTVEIRMSSIDRSSTPPSGETSERRRDLDWILRRSEGDVLRDRRPAPAGPLDGAIVAEAGEAPDARLAWARFPMDGAITQSFSGWGPFGGEDSGPGDASGRSTRLRLNGEAGPRGSWRFDGLAGRTMDVLAPAGPARRGFAAAGLGAGFDYRLGPDDGLRTDVRYRGSRYLFDPGGASAGIDQDRRAASVRARWDRRLEEGALLYVAGSYLAAGRDPAAGAPGSATEPPGEAGGLVGDRSLGARAGLSFRADDHDVGFGLLIHSFAYDLEDGGALLASAGAGAVPLEEGRRGGAMSLFGGDDWRVAERHVITYGLGYHGDWSSGRSYVVPRVGMTSTLWAGGDLRVRSAVMYRVDDGGRFPADFASADRGAVRSRQGARLGYEIGIEGSPDDALQFAASLSYRSFEAVGDGGLDDPAAGPLADEGPLVLADAAAARREMEIQVRRGFGPVRGSLAGSVGRIRGRVSPLLGEAPVRDLMPGEARFYLTTLSAQIDPTDTEVRVDYRRVTGDMDPGITGEPGSLAYRRLDLAVLQDLPFSPFAFARWRVLMAYQGLLLDPLDDAALPGAGATSRVTGGVDISF